MPRALVSTYDLAQRFVDSYLRDGTWVVDLYGSTAHLWRSSDDYQCPLRDAVLARSWIKAMLPSFEVVGVDWRAWPDGFIVECAYAARLPADVMVRVPVCLVGSVRRGRITSIAEYTDAKTLRPIHDALDP